MPKKPHEFEMITKDDYLKRHIPHRINLLMTYKERFSGLDTETRKKVGEISRDFLRCSKDISMLMVRFLLNELGIKLQKGHTDISETKNAPYTDKLKVNDVICNPNYQNILDVLKAANRAVAHMEATDVDHAIEKDPDDQILFEAIIFTRDMCIKKMYDINAYDFNLIMNDDDNNMHRERLRLPDLI